MAGTKRSSKGKKPLPKPDEPGAPPAPAPVEAALPGAEPAVPLVPRPETSFPVVGIGASAGGLAAFEAFLSAMPADLESEMAFVLVQHLSPDHESILTDLIKRYTRMQVFEVEDNMQVRPNCAYIIPPNRDMAFLNGTLQLLEPTAPRGLRLPIDFFFRSLAQDQRERAICIVLSGTGSDGTLGIRAVKGEGGMVMAQDPETTQYDGMPRSAIATGLVDYVLPPARMPAQLVAYVAHAFSRKPRPVSPPAPQVEDSLKKLCVLLRDRTGHDFSGYKRTTIVRRVERRMALHQIERSEDYLRFAHQTPAEVEGLFRDLLIGVTSFFRDPEAFETLRTRVIPGLFQGKSPGRPIRIWVCGCSTGEEAYSIGIILQEHLETVRHAHKVQVFATDIDSHAVEQARAGVFPVSIAADVSPERLARFFTQDHDGGPFRIHKVIRDLLVFSDQNVIRDPPFSRLDLISCRNLLIYLSAQLQKRIIPLFHYALNPGGVLFLGSSETVGEFFTLFSTTDRKWKLYQRQADRPGAVRPVLGEFARPAADAKTHAPPGPGDGPDGARTDLRRLTESALLEHCGPAGVLVNGRGEILHIHGRTGRFLEPAPGDAVMNVVSMAREGLSRELATALHQAVARGEPVRRESLKVKTNGDRITVDLTVRPVTAGEGRRGDPGTFLVGLEESAPTAPVSPGGAAGEGAGVPAAADARIAALEQELRAKEEYLQTTIEEMETANEELKSTNEEMQSVNEELQSTNEELETSKEELQSVNEELATVNVELQTKVSELSRTNNDLNNLLAGTGVGTLFLDSQLRISRFTPQATQVINLIQTDIGRPVTHIVSNLVGYDRLVEDVKAVLTSLVPREAEVQTRANAWYQMNIRPYRTLENVIEGAVITFVEITDRKRMAMALHEVQSRLAGALVATLREPLLVLDGSLRVIAASRAFQTTFDLHPDRTLGRLVYDLDDGRWDFPGLRRLLEEVLPATGKADDLELTHDFHRLGRRTLRINACRVKGETAELGRDEPLGLEAGSTDPSREEPGLDLRRRAEERARALGVQHPDGLSAEETARLVHELRVHQIELELQNEELRQTQESLQRWLSRYFDLYDLAPVGYVTVNEKGAIDEANLTAAALLGMTRVSLIGRPLTMSIHPEDQDIYYLHRRLLLERRDPGSCELRMLRADGTPIWVRMESTVTLDTRDGSRTCRITLSDITGRKRAEAEHDELQASLAQARKLESVGLLAGGVAHEFNNILTTILGYSELMAEGFSRGDPLASDLAEIRTSADRAVRLTSQLLAFARRQLLEPRAVDLNRVVTDLAAMLGRLIGEHIELRLDLAEDLGRVWIDPGQLEQVIVNLTVNARDALPDGGTLTFRTAAFVSGAGPTDLGPGPYVILAVTDTGRGMDEATRARVFEPFFTTKPRGQGTGLGLSMVHGIVEQSGGRIWCQSEPGRGTTFTLCLPRVEDSAEAPDGEPSEAVSPGGSGTILLVEDEAAVRGLLGRVLAGDGYTLLQASDGAEALLLYADRREPIDLLITDVVMPGMSGTQLAEAMRARRADLKVLYMSGYTDETLVRLGLTEGTIDFMPKPIVPAVLRNKVREVLAR
ncbi:MAG: PAS domain-containing protein [Candidatus Riflebacteria bacterium]|nr:PAS domain-containing protein [Candidatus Riflebacteria bacterium]